MADSSIIGKIQSALMSATNEFTATAAQINFDFTMVKYEAPPEYQALNQSLSQRRRQDAESGQAHVTARRLGALFDGIPPPTPKLISAYGTRASDIFNDVSARGSLKVSNWIFSEYAGIDATSIWAAATSRKAALPVHLLACLLARIWDESEATSIWVEIVAERRKEVAAKFESGAEVPIAQTTAAMQGEITREQLSKWDASARSWLRTADTVKNLQQKQLLLIVKNISIPVNLENNPYKSIMAAWTSALETMELLISGAPHVVRDGAVLIALSAWHLYPDMVIFSGSDGSKEILMNDPLIHPGGILSLGISDSGNRATKGVYWSLSLAHHKFYGRAINKLGQLDSDGSRMTFAELQQAVLGVILAHWNVLPDQTADALKLLLQIVSSLPFDQLSFEDRWIEMITTPILSYFQDEESGTIPISFGRRRRGFIPSPPNGPERPFFGLTDMAGLFPQIKSAELRVEFLRRLAQRVAWLQDTEAWIAFRLDKVDSADADAADVDDLDHVWCFATVFPSDSTKGESRPRHHRRWVPHWMATAGDRVPNPHSEHVLYLSATFPLICHSRDSITSLHMPHEQKEFDFLFGDANSAAVFVLRETTFYAGRTGPTITTDDVRWCLQYDVFSQDSLQRHILDNKSPIIQSLFLLTYASLLYSFLSPQGATISPRIFSAPFRIQLISEYVESRSENLAFLGIAYGSSYTVYHNLALVAYFESGFDVVRSRMDGVLGLSIGDSIYVPGKLTEDPSTSHETTTIHFSRLLGNIGNPGLTVLTCPASPEAREVDLMGWRKAADNYTGTQDNCFNQTTLHLSFTEWKSPLWMETAVGQRDTQCMHVEAVVSVRDSGQWVADVDIMKALTHADVQFLRSQEEKCPHSTPQPPGRQILALETWDQILDCPDGIVVTKSHGNWVARLALVSVLAQHCKTVARKIIVCPDKVCWKCVDFPSFNNAVYVY